MPRPKQFETLEEKEQHSKEYRRKYYENNKDRLLKRNQQKKDNFISSIAKLNRIISENKKIIKHLRDDSIASLIEEKLDDMREELLLMRKNMYPCSKSSEGEK